MIDNVRKILSGPNKGDYVIHTPATLIEVIREIGEKYGKTETEVIRAFFKLGFIATNSKDPTMKLILRDSTGDRELVVFDIDPKT